MADPPRVRSIEEAEVVIQSIYARQEILLELTRDHAQRFDTLQTPWWKRVWFWIDGWPWYDLNGTQKKRPWHRGR
jgi:hypothetical protein